MIRQLEYTRGGVPLVKFGLYSRDPRIQQLTIRAIGRRQNADLRDTILPFLQSPNVAVREETANALGQMNAVTDYESLLKKERTGSVRASLFESIGRIKTPSANAEGVLATGLSDESPAARVGAARGIEALVRQKGRGARIAPSTAGSIHAAFRANSGQAIRELLLLTMNSGSDQDSVTLALALRDTSALVRRLAVIGSKRWVDDKSPLVRYEALRVAPDCEHALEIVNDASEMVALAAIDMLGDRQCDAGPLEQMAARGTSWRARAHALVALAKAKPASAHRLLASFAHDTLWHSRVYAATAARILGDTETLSQLAHDLQPNVATEALTTPSDAIHALQSSHAGLLLAAANKLKGTPELSGAMPQIVAALTRLAAERRASTTDARVALMERIAEAGSNEDAQILVDAMSDLQAAPLFRARDIQKRKGGVLDDHALVKPTHSTATAVVPALSGATARITMKGLGVITLQLLSDEAPMTVFVFAMLADSGQYNGLTFHRVVPDFVIQGGSPGADEYDGLTKTFMKDEVGRTSHTRGTFGISTRGYDTGDGQIFINLVDNFRLDHQYTVFARVTSGMDVVDRVQEGDIIESVTIIRKK